MIVKCKEEVGGDMLCFVGDFNVVRIQK